MIRVELVAVTADSGPLFWTTGPVNRWSHSLARDVRTAAHERTPGGTPGRSRARHGPWPHTGELARSFNILHRTYPAARRIRVDVSNTSGHALYVHEGTANNGAGFIYTKLGYSNRFVVDRWVDTGVRPDLPDYYMPVTRVPGQPHFALRVRGQQANPFLADGLDAAFRKHRLL